MNTTLFSRLIFLSLILLSGQLYAWNTLTNELDVSCQQSNKNLACEYRILSQEPSLSINASSNNTKLPLTRNNQYLDKDDITAILFLVDTSDPARQNVIEKNKAHIKKLLTTLKPHHKAGLASFDKSLKIQSPIGTSTFLLSKSLDSLKAAGKTIEIC